MENEKVVEEKSYEYKITNMNEVFDLCKSSDYKDRFIGEYVETKIRYDRLHKMLVALDAGTLDFVPNCPPITLRNQKSAMGNYLNQLEIRFEQEKIPLPTILIK